MTEYAFGYSEEEFERLQEQHRIWLPWMREHLQAGGVKPGDVVLDLGCGPGFASTEMARSGVTVLAFDRDPQSLADLKSRCERDHIANIHVLPSGDAANLPRLPIQPSAVYMRWLLCYLGRDGTETLIATLAERLAPDCRLLVHDYINYRSARLEPSSEAVERVIHGFYEDLSDADIGFALPAILTRHGFEIVWKRIVPLAIAPDDEAWSWPDHFFRVHVPPSKLTERFWNDWKRAINAPGAFFYSWPVIQLVAKRHR